LLSRIVHLTEETVGVKTCRLRLIELDFLKNIQSVLARRGAAAVERFLAEVDGQHRVDSSKFEQFEQK
jgi:hypothetical protein